MTFLSETESFVNLKKDKISRISSILTSKKVSINRVKMFAMGRFGLITNDLRKKAWLLMHGIEENADISVIDEAAILAHKEYHQVLMDVNRSLKRFPPGMDEVVRMAMQDQLVNLIIRTLMHNKSLHYYQGFHDVCVTFLLVLNENQAYQLLCKLTSSHFIDFMTPTMEATSQLLYLIYAIVELENPGIIRILQQVSVEPFFALPWVITWFGHVLGDLKRILRVYDFFLASDPIMPVYLSAAIVLYRQQDIEDTEVDFAQLHHMLTSLPKTLPIEQLISDAMDLYLKHGPDQVVISRTLPRQLNLRLTTIGSDILRRRKGPVGDSIDTRTRTGVSRTVVQSLLSLVVTGSRQGGALSYRRWAVAALAVAVVAVLLRMFLVRLLV